MLSTYQELDAQVQIRSRIARRVLGFHPGGELAMLCRLLELLTKSAGISTALS
jgi:hypothetical protein